MKINIENRARLTFAIVILLGAVAGLAWYFLASSQYTTYQIRTHDLVSGLIADAPVEFHGVQVGKVKRVELTDAQSVSILLSVKKEAPVTTATVATITARGLASRGFTGYVYVSLEDVGTDVRPLTASPGNPFPLIHNAPSRSVNLDTAISQLNENVQFITELLQSVLDKKTVASLKESVDGLQQVTRTLAANNEKLGSIILNTERASNQLTPLLESSNDAVKALQTQVLPEAYKALTNLDSASRSLSGVATKIDRDPSILIRGIGAPPPGPGETK
jgi:phospholipid/cholesterol/gamma-HCH transport system substrate-binding protein